MRTAIACAVLMLASGVAGSPVDDLASRDRKVALYAADRVFRMGTAAIPALMKFRGDRRPYMGRVLGEPRAAMTAPDPSAVGRVPDEKIISVEAAALYLIEAIHHRRLDFAESAYLTDLKLPPIDRKAENTRALVDRAWASVENWYRSGMKGDPLAASDVAFW